MNYKDDMNAEKFEAFLHELFQELIEQGYEKIAVVMDNASYHTVMVRVKSRPIKFLLYH